jgi:type II secretory pathway pseudopilin PulG
VPAVRRRRSTSGITLLELVVALLLSSVAVAGAYRLLLTVGRFLRLQSATMEVHQSLRAAAQVLEAELRELDPQGGDIVAMGADSISIRAMRALAVTCTSPAPGSGAIVTRDRLSFGYRAVDPERDRALVLTAGGSGSAGGDAWQDFGISSVSPGARCDDGAAGTRLALVAGVGPADAIAAGSPVRTYERVVYRLYADESGTSWLGIRGMTRGSWAAISPVTGPLERGAGLALSYRDSSGAPTTDPGRVAAVAFSLRAVSSAILPRARGGSGRYADSLRAVVTPRNGRGGDAP